MEVQSCISTQYYPEISSIVRIGPKSEEGQRISMKPPVDSHGTINQHDWRNANRSVHKAITPFRDSNEVQKFKCNKDFCSNKPDSTSNQSPFYFAPQKEQQWQKETACCDGVILRHHCRRNPTGRKHKKCNQAERTPLSF